MKTSLTRRLLGVLALLLVSGVAGAQTPTAVSQKKELTIYIGPQTTDGFIEGMSHRLLKFSGGSVDAPHYATFSSAMTSPSC